MSTDHSEADPFRKSSYSTQDNCVEVALGVEVVRVRDTKDRDGGTLAVPSGSWRTFADACKAGEFGR
ncbi:DUF397 domain-containing protein [Cryptosporangium sp. NPDC048952]|uniref:DUF397 domain-containing protein n=1 Tax=Cryptosporangium sp. NPDC048952 TaxID=3363961 RepID=UPI003717398B